MKRNILYVELERCPMRVVSTKRGVPQKEYVAQTTKDGRGLYLNDLGTVPLKVLAKLDK